MGCSKSTSPPTAKPTVLVSIAPYAYLVEKIAGDTVSIHTLVPPKTNLHVYEPTPKEVQESIGAAVWFRIDEPMEKKVVEAIQEHNPEQLIVNLQEGLSLLGEDHDHELAPCGGHHGDKDLHTWLSPTYVLAQAKQIATTLATLFPEHKGLYQEKGDELFTSLERLDHDLKKSLTPFRGDALLISHPSLGYFCHDYGLIQLSVECQGKDPRPKDIEELIRKTKTYRVRCVFLQQGFNNRGAELIGQKLGLPIYEIDPYDRDLIHTMRHLAHLLAQ